MDNNKNTTIETVPNKNTNDTITNNVVGVKPNDTLSQENTLSDTLSPWTSLIPIALMFTVFYWFLIRPQEKRRREQESLIKSVKAGDKIITGGGIHGVVYKVIDDNTIELEISPNTNIKMLKSAILEIPSRKLNGNVITS